MKAFQTCRRYTEHGQIIVWEVVRNEICAETLFRDISRKIDGVFPFECIGSKDLMTHYDAGGYCPGLSLKDCERLQLFGEQQIPKIGMM